MNASDEIHVTVRLTISPPADASEAEVREQVRVWLGALRGRPFPALRTAVLKAFRISEPRADSVARLVELAGETGWQIGFFAPPSD